MTSHPTSGCTGDPWLLHPVCLTVCLLLTVLPIIKPQDASLYSFSFRVMLYELWLGNVLLLLLLLILLLLLLFLLRSTKALGEDACTDRRRIHSYTTSTLLTRILTSLQLMCFRRHFPSWMGYKALAQPTSLGDRFSPHHNQNILSGARS